jgi:hypothetical protein
VRDVLLERGQTRVVGAPKRLRVGYFCVMQQILLEGALLASTFAADRTEEVVVRLKGWIERHRRELAMVGLFGIGVLLAACGALTIS